MFQLTVKDLNGIVLHQPNFPTIEEANKMKADILAFNGYNFPFHIETTSAYQENIPATPDILDADGNVVTQGMPEHIIIHQETFQKIPDFTIEIVDLTPLEVLEESKIFQIKQAQLNAAHALQTLPAQIDQCADLESLKTLIKAFVINVATLLQE